MAAGQTPKAEATVAVSNLSIALAASIPFIGMGTVDNAIMVIFLSSPSMQKTVLLPHVFEVGPVALPHTPMPCCIFSAREKATHTNLVYALAAIYTHA